MSYWGTSPAWGPVRRGGGPSPVVPLLVVLALGWVICNETLTAWYELVAGVQETVAGNAVFLVLTAGFLVLAAAVISGSRRGGEVVIVPVVLVLVMLLIQNIMVAMLLLLVAAYFAGIYYYPPDRRYGGYSGDGGVTGGEWFGGLGFYMLLLLCLVLCAMFSEEGVSWWIPGVMLAACLLFLNLFSGGKVLGYGNL